MPRPEGVLLTGASSQLGVWLLPRLLEAGLRVTAVSRRAPAAGWRPDRQVLWLPPSALAAGAGSAASENPADPVFLVSCGPLDYSADLVGRLGSLQRVVAFSSSSLLSSSTSYILTLSLSENDVSL